MRHNSIYIPSALLKQEFAQKSFHCSKVKHQLIFWNSVILLIAKSANFLLMKFLMIFKKKSISILLTVPWFDMAVSLPIERPKSNSGARSRLSYGECYIIRLWTVIELFCSRFTFPYFCLVNCILLGVNFFGYINSFCKHRILANF